WGLTFGGLRELITQRERESGIYTTSVQFDPTRAGAHSNVYTWYVPLLHDFGVPGTLAVLFALGMLLAPLTLKASAGTASPSQLGMLACLLLVLADALIQPLTFYNFWYILLLLAPLLPATLTVAPTTFPRSDRSSYGIMR
ncbi:MAG: hypothetical protein ACREXY_25100, partial [Gammaproteobacteria bacterium]